MYARSSDWKKYSNKFKCFFCHKRLKPGGLFVARSADGRWVWGGGKQGRSPVCRRCGRLQPWWAEKSVVAPAPPHR